MAIRGINRISICVLVMVCIASSVMAQKTTTSKKPTFTPTKPAAKPYTPPADTTIYVKAFFIPGTVKHLEYDKCQQRYNKRDSTISNLCTHYTVSIKVDQKRTDGYRILWHYDNISIVSGFDRQGPFRRALEKMLEGVQVELLLDSAGAYIDTDDWYITKEQLTHKVDSMKVAFKEDSVAQKYIVKLYRIVENKDLMEPIITEQAALYFTMYGRYIDQKQGAVTSCRFPDVFGGDPFQATGKIVMDTLNRKNKTMALSWHQGIDKQQAHDMLKKTLTLQAKINSRPIPSDDAIPQVDVYEDYTLHYPFLTTWLTHISYTKVTTNGKAGERDTIDMILK